MKTVYLLAVALAIPLVAGGQSSKPKTTNGRTVIVQDDPAVNLLTTADAGGLVDLDWTVAGGQSSTKVDLDVRNANVSEALKELFSKTKAEYKIVDKELPDAHMTLNVKQVRFSTALDMIMQCSGLHYSVQVQDGKTTYRIGKKVSSTPGVFFNNSFGTNGNALTFTPRNGSLDLYNNILKTKPQHWNYNLQGNTLKSLTLDPNSAFVYTMGAGENRSTFICPHCKGQATVIRQRQLPKCPKCSRTFQGDWQFCPFDGARRPAVTGGWKYCPICGKEVQMEKDDPKKTGDSRVPLLGDIPLLGNLFRKDPVTAPKEDDGPVVVALQYVAADSIVSALPKQLGAARVAVVDSRTNSVILTGPSADVKQLADTVRSLDRK